MERKLTPSETRNYFINETEEIYKRLGSFLQKLEAKMKEFTDESIPELEEMNANLEEVGEDVFYRMKSAVLGQLSKTREKADTIMEEKVHGFPEVINEIHFRDEYYNFRNKSIELYKNFEDVYNQHVKRVHETENPDYEKQYADILNEFESIKNNFKCNQCGSPIEIPELYFTTTYLECPACFSKNTFQPSTKAKGLELLGRRLAESRNRNLWKEIESIPDQLQELYNANHKDKLSLIHENNKGRIQEVNNKMAERNALMKKLEEQSIEKQREYWRAFTDDWNSITPSMKEGHENFYKSQIKNINQ